MNLNRTTDDAWRALVRSVVEQGTDVPGVQDPLSVGSGFGDMPRDTREIIVAGLGIEDIRSRLFCSAVRRFRLGFAIAQVIWAFSGSDRVDALTFYQPRGSAFSDDGATVRSAIGRRVFRSPHGDQLLEAINKLRQDPSTRRALIQIYTPEDLFVRSRDVSCTGSLQFFARDGALHAVGHMRSQSALVVLPYDLFLITMLHEFAAVQSGLRPGIYWHVSNSAHIYADELRSASALLGESQTHLEPMPPMPSCVAEEIETVIQAEQQIRLALAHGSIEHVNLDGFTLSAYWRNLLHALIVDSRLRQGCKWVEAGGNFLPEIYQGILITGQPEGVVINR